MYLRRAHRISIGIVLLLLALAGMYAWRGPAVVTEAQALGEGLWKKASRPPPPSAEEKRQSAKSGPHGADGKAGAKSAPAAQMRKCIQAERVTYTNEACPQGSREEAVSDNLSVMSNAP